MEGIESGKTNIIEFSHHTVAKQSVDWYKFRLPRLVPRRAAHCIARNQWDLGGDRLQTSSEKHRPAFAAIGQFNLTSDVCVCPACRVRGPRRAVNGETLE